MNNMFDKNSWSDIWFPSLVTDKSSREEDIDNINLNIWQSNINKNVTKRQRMGNARIKKRNKTPRYIQADKTEQLDMVLRSSDGQGLSQIGLHMILKEKEVSKRWSDMLNLLEDCWWQGCDVRDERSGTRLPIGPVTPVSSDYYTRKHGIYI